MKYIAQDAVKRGLSYLETERYGPDPIRAYGKERRRLAKYCDERYGGLLDEAAVGRFLADTGIPGTPLTAYEKQRFRAAHALLDIAETGRPAPMYGDRTRFKVPSRLLDTYRAYEDRLAGREYADSTTRRKLGFARNTLSWLGESGVGSAEGVTAAAMSEFAGSLSGMAAQSRTTWLYFVREFAGEARRLRKRFFARRRRRRLAKRRHRQRRQPDHGSFRGSGREYRDDGHRRLGRARGGGVLASAAL